MLITYPGTKLFIVIINIVLLSKFILCEVFIHLILFYIILCILESMKAENNVLPGSGKKKKKECLLA